MNTTVEKGVADWLRVLLATAFADVPVLTADDETPMPEQGAAEPRFVRVICEEDRHEIGPLYLPEIRSRNQGLRQYAERSAINAPMQGTAADIIKRAMITVHDWLRHERARARLVMQVHDELVLEVREDAVEAIEHGLRERMAAAAELRVPLKVEVGRGPHWDAAH
jgi:hypothetical protein